MPDILDKTQTTSVSQTDSAIYVVNSRTTTPVDRWETPGDFHKNRTGNDSVLAFASLSAAITAIGVTEATIEIPATTTVSTSLSSPTNVTICFTGPGQISVASGQQLVIHGSIQAPIRQIFSGTGTVKFGGRVCDAFPEWFGATGNNSTDDAAAIQKAIDAFKDTGVQHHPGRVYLNAGYAIGSTLLITGNSVRLIGSGWGVQNDDPYRGFIRWIGSAGSPMIKITECWGSGVEYLRIIGNSAAKPSAGIEFASTNTVHGLDFSFLHHVYIGHMYGYDSDQAVQFDNGILFSGTVDGDANKFEHIAVVGATTGVNVDNANAADSHWDSLFVQNCTTGFKCKSFAVGTNWFFALNTVDIDMAGAGSRLMLRHCGSEGSGRLATMAGTAVSLMITGGSFECGSNFSVADDGDDRWLIDAHTTFSQYIELEDFIVTTSGTPKNHVIRMGFDSGGSSHFLRLINTNLNLEKNVRFEPGGTTAGGFGVVSYGSVECVQQRKSGTTPSLMMRQFLNTAYTTDKDLENWRNDFPGKLNTWGGPFHVKYLPTPSGGSATPTGSGATTYSYKLTALTRDGETEPSAAFTCVNGVLGTGGRLNTLQWQPRIGAHAYRIYGRTSGTWELLKTLDDTELFDGFPTWIDDGSLTPAGSPPTKNGTGRAYLGCPDLAPTDSFIENGQWTGYLDVAGNKLKFRVRYPDGTLKTGEIALT